MLVSLVAASLLLSPPSTAGGELLPGPAADPLADPLAALEARGNTETFLAMLEMSGIRTELETSGKPFTLLAPKDSAFRGVAPETVARLFEPDSRATLRSILLAHVVAGDVDALSMLQLTDPKAMSGFGLSAAIQGGRLFVSGAAVSAQDLPCSAGAAHEIDSVILPDPSVLEPTAARRIASRAVGLASAEGLTGAGQRAIYQVAVASLAELGDATQELRDVRVNPAPTLDELRTVVFATLGQDSPQMTSPLTSPLTSQMISSEEGPDGAADEASLVLVEFDGGDADPSWFTLNDDVMGGISQSQFQLVEEGGGVGLFTGALSMENNGGFASIRSSRDEYDLSEYKGLRLRVKTDGREYGVSAIAGDSRGRSGSWRKRFQVAAGEWTTVDIPFDDMVLNIRGRKYPDVGPPKRDAIQSFSFIIGDKDTTPFRFEVASIRAYR